ncbi:MAG: RIP metalloprotease RseP [Lentisphaerae bacterium]|nr:RIP metalloprotease RseP [Lentisphaerota bacterium]
MAMNLILELLGNVWTGVLLAAFFGVSIFIHELGHYLVARWCGLQVDTFAIGFGPAIWKRTYGGVIYKIGIFPIGGYVALPQLDPSGMSRIQGAAETGASPAEASLPNLPAIAPWKKILVSVAGAVGNVILAFIMAWAVYLIGMPAGPAERSSLVGFVDTKGAAYEAGLRVGDTILSVNGVPVHKWSDVPMEVVYHQMVELRVRTAAGEERTISVATEKGALGAQQLPGVDGPSLCLVQRADPAMAAGKAGIKQGDVIVKFAGQDVFSRGHLIQLVQASEGRPDDIVVRREGPEGVQLLTLNVTPAKDPEGRVRIGVEFNLVAVEHDTVVRPRPLEQIKSHALLIFRFLEALTTPKQAKAASTAVGGPVAILVSYWYIVKTSPMLAIWFTGLLNINLAIINLLPIPVLDGGHICFSLYEMIRRKPMHPKLVSALVNAFAFLLIGLILLISVRDVDRFTPVGKLVRGLFGHEKPAATGSATNAPAPASAPAQ